jgi:hypothetical protein
VEVEEAMEDALYGAVLIVGASDLLTLPMRNLGTRVWIRCSRFFTRALISDTIWTPLLLEAVAEVLEAVLVVLTVETLRAVI